MVAPCTKNAGQPTNDEERSRHREPAQQNIQKTNTKSSPAKKQKGNDAFEHKALPSLQPTGSQPTSLHREALSRNLRPP